MATARKGTSKPVEKATEGNFTLDQPYLISSKNDPITVEVIIGGQGMSSTTNIRINKREIKIDGQGSIPETLVGNGNDLNGKLLFITTVITNSLGEVNQATSTIKLRGGLAPTDFKLSAPVKKGNNVIFTSIIEFLIV